MPVWGGAYENPFYHASLGYVKGELAARANNAGRKIRAGKTNKALEWSYGKTAYGHISGGGITLGFPGSKVMSDSSGNLKLYNSRNVPKFPLLQSIDITNDGTIGSLLRGKFTFTYFPEMYGGGFSMAGIDKAFFTPGKDVVLSWGWSYGGAGSRQSFTGIVNNFNWSFNADLSMTADCSVVSAATIALGMSGDQTVKPAEGAPVEEVQDPTEVAIQASNLSSVIDGDLGLGDKEPAEEGTPPIPKDPPVTTDTGGAGIPVFEPKEPGEILILPKSNTINKYLDYVGIGWPFQDSQPDEEVTPKDPPDPPGDSEGAAAVKPFWYITVGTLVDFTNMLIEKFEGTGGATALGKIIKVLSDGNYTQGYADIQSAYPIDVIFPNSAMGSYGECKPAYGSVESEFGIGEKIFISGILLGVDWVKKSYDEFITENAANIPYKNITKFLETVLKRINIASGDMYQISAVLCEPPTNFDGNSSAGLSKTILSIEDANIAKSITDDVDAKAIRFEATIFKPLIKSVSISSKPPAAMAAAAYTKARGGKPSNIETPTGAAGATDTTTADIAKAVANFTKTGFNLSWCEAFRGLLTKKKKLASIPGSAHWINQALYPIDFTVTIDGISGFRFGDVIKTSLVPTSYNNAGLVFVVTKIDHKISAAGWETTLSTAARIGMGKFG
jgi:hypothetical protein